MRSYGKVYSTFWSDQRTAMLSDRGKVLALYLLTGPHSNGIGCYRLPEGYVSADLQWPTETVSETLSELLSVRFIDRCETTGWTFVRRFLKHNTPENPNVCKSLIPAIEVVPPTLPFYQGLMEAVETVSERHPKGFPEGFVERLRERMPNMEPKPSHSQAIAKPQPVVPTEMPEPLPSAAAAAAAGGDHAAEVISLFDECRVEVFGENLKRPWPGPKDRPAALEIIEVEADVDALRAVFLAVFGRQKAQGQQPANSLRYMLSAVAEAAERPTKPQRHNGRHSAADEGVDMDGTWEVWLQMFRDGKGWLGDGPAPGKPGCRAPKHILRRVMPEAA